jgi:hypothetical protein
MPPAPQDDDRHRIPPLLTYTVARLGLMVAVGVLCYLLGFREWALLLLTVLVSLPLSYLLLRRQREALSASMDGRLAARRRLRAELRGDDELATPVRSEDDREPRP